MDFLQALERYSLSECLVESVQHLISWCHAPFFLHKYSQVSISKSGYLYPAPESWRRLSGTGRSRTGASSVPAWRRSPTGPVTIVLVADDSVWLVRWLRNFVVQLQSGRMLIDSCHTLPFYVLLQLTSVKMFQLQFHTGFVALNSKTAKFTR